MTDSSSSTAVRQQLEYYRARAGEYDEWWLRRGRYDRGPEANAEWFRDADVVARAIDAFQPAGAVLELACGTGIWTERLVRCASSVTAVDGSPEVIAVNAARLASPLVRYVQADIFEWRPDALFDVVFFGFWLSHVPPERFDAFWNLVRSCLAPDGRVFFVDSRREQTSSALNHQLPGPDEILQTRRLNDGREFQVFKIFYEPVELHSRLRALGWDFDVRETGRYFVYGSGRPRPRTGQQGSKSP